MGAREQNLKEQQQLAEKQTQQMLQARTKVKPKGEVEKLMVKMYNGERGNSGHKDKWQRWEAKRQEKEHEEYAHIQALNVHRRAKGDPMRFENLYTDMEKKLHRLEHVR